MSANASEAEEGEGKRARIIERSERWPTWEVAMTEVGGAHGHGAGEGVGGADLLRGGAGPTTDLAGRGR
jgi:hypothetical protein